MGIFQRGIETYDYLMDHLSEVASETAMPVAPICHYISNATLTIVLTKDGDFYDVDEVDKANAKFAFPVTEKSLVRTVNPVPHGLCENLKYLDPSSGEFIRNYVDQLSGWATSEYSHPFLYPVLKYVKSGTILTDIYNSGLTKYFRLDESGNIRLHDPKAMVRWSVVDVSSREVENCWECSSLMTAWADYYMAVIQQDSKRDLCMMTGKMAVLTEKHPKAIFPTAGNAKLISANDDKEFTFRGRFENAEQALSVSFEGSQKSHIALKWLSYTRSVIYGQKAFVCWIPKNNMSFLIDKPMDQISGQQAIPEFDLEKADTSTPVSYRSALRRILDGRCSDVSNEDNVVIAVFQAPSKGCGSVTYYSELPGKEFFQRLYKWDAGCAWWFNGNLKTPPLRQIVLSAFGTQRGAWLEASDAVMARQMEALITCRMATGLIPRSLVMTLVEKASTPLRYDQNIWRSILNTTCAVLNKYYKDMEGIEPMEWTLDKPDRSFQFGRLLAVLERAEEDYYYFSNTAPRQPNAQKEMAAFRQHPMDVFERLNRFVSTAYVARIPKWAQDRYARIRDQALETLTGLSGEDLNAPLANTYLLGYSLQRRAFYTKKNQENTEE